MSTITSAATGKPPAMRAGEGRNDRVLATATVTVATGALLTMLPLRSIFTDWTWLAVNLGCVLAYLLVVTCARWNGRAHSWTVLAGLVCSAMVLVWVFVPDHLLYGVVPTRSSLTDLSSLLDQAHQTMQAGHAPLPSTAPLRLLSASAAILLVALTDILGVLWRRPLLAAAPLLEVLAVASATSSRASSPLYFVCAAVGFLLILVAGTRLQDLEWGPSVDGSDGRLRGGRRMAITGIAAALVLPVALPSMSVNLLARAAHHTGDGSGSANGQQIELNDTASLTGSLQRGTQVDLLKVEVAPTDQPFYIRQVVLDKFTQAGWVRSASNGLSRPLDLFRYPIAPTGTSGSPGDHVLIKATFTVLNLGGDNLPLLANPVGLSAVSSGSWDPVTATANGVRVKRGLTYIETAEQPSPSPAALAAAPGWARDARADLDQRYLGLPQQDPAVIELANKLTADAGSAYDKARAISNYFTDSNNNFVYSLRTDAVTGGNALLSFLRNKKGFCQQYAAAAAVLMREAGLASRVVLGYTHKAPDPTGSFTVTTSDAHAWVEVYFGGIGWVPFDPTPLAGSDVSREVQLPWAPHTAGPLSTAGASSAPAVTGPAPRPTVGPATGGPEGLASSTSSDGAPWNAIAASLVIAFLLVMLLFGPTWARRQQRRRRLSQARASGNPESLWRELAATATDRGALWPSTLTVGQVPRWLADHGVDERDAAAALVVAKRVELARFSDRPAASGVREDAEAAQAINGFDEALRRWGRHREGRRWGLNWWLPRSLFSRRDQWQR